MNMLPVGSMAGQTAPGDGEKRAAPERESVMRPMETLDEPCTKRIRVILPR